MLPRYSTPALQNKLRRIKESGRVTLSSLRSSTSDLNAQARKDEREPGSPNMTMSAETSFNSKLRNKHFERENLASGEAPTALLPRSDGTLGVSKSQGNEAIESTNLRAIRKGGMMIWFDEEIQLLKDLKRQDKPWEEVFEVGSPSACLPGPRKDYLCPWPRLTRYPWLGHSKAYLCCHPDKVFEHSAGSKMAFEGARWPVQEGCSSAFRQVGQKRRLWKQGI